MKKYARRTPYRCQNVSRIVSDRVSQEEYEILEERCQKAGISISMALRKGLIDQNVYIIPGLDDLSYQVAKIGINVNQIARALNSQQFAGVQEDVRKIQRDISEIKGAILQIYRKVVCNSVQREHDKKLNNGLPILHMIPPYRDYGRYFCIMAEKGGTMRQGLMKHQAHFLYPKQEVLCTWQMIRT